MRFAILTSLAFLGGLVAATLPGYVDKCYDGKTCCTNPYASRLFRRTGTTPCDPKKVCCEEKKIPKFDTSTELKCGKSNVKSSTVRATVKPCPKDASQYCLHVFYAPFGDGTKYTEYHLQLSKDPITSSTPGKFGFSDTCQLGEGNLSIDCYVSLTRVASSVYGNPTFDFCMKKPLYIAAHAVYGKETCWAGATPIEQKPNNWAKYFSGYFDCQTICKKECQCPCPPPPPPGDKYCEKGTGYAFNRQCSKDGKDCDWQLDNLAQCNQERWGWWFGISSTAGEHTYELVEGAGGNDYSKGTVVGSVKVTVTDTKVEISYTMNAPYAINVAHIDLKCSKEELKCAPGQYSFNSGCLGNQPGFQKSLSKPNCAAGRLYLIFHADVTVKKPVTDTCSAVKC
jgi:hypothetical protein